MQSIFMHITELQNVVILETICLALIITIIVCAFYRWKAALLASISITTLAFFSAWSNIMAFGSLLVYGTAPVLLLLQLDKKGGVSETKKRKFIHFISWTILAIGVLVLILNNLRNIFLHLH